MIVYNHGRRWFAKKEEAEAWRRQTVNPAPVIKVTVEHRDELASLLNMLCEPAAVTYVPPGYNTVIDRAFVTVEKQDFLDYVPRFLLDDEGKKEWDRRHQK